MATAYYTPGVYIEEVNSGPRPIQGVGTSVAAFIGITEKAEQPTEDGYTTESLLSKAKLITNITQYEKHFGGLSENAYLPYAVRGFFENGGVTCWVISIHALNALSAQTLLFAANGDGSTPDPKKPTLLIHAKEGGPLGENIKVWVEEGDTAGNNTSTVKTVPTVDVKDTTSEKGSKDKAKQPDAASSISRTGPATNSDKDEDKDKDKKFTLIVEKSGTKHKSVLNIDTIPQWGSGTQDVKDFTPPEDVEIWSLQPKAGKLAERMPAAFKEKEAVSLKGGTSKFDVDLLLEPDRKAIQTTPTPSLKDDEILKGNAVQLFNGSERDRKGKGALESLDNVNLICAPDLALMHKNGTIDDTQLMGLQNALLGYCQNSLYRFAILDSPYSKKQPEEILKWRQEDANFDSMHGALYYPWIKITDPLTGRSKEVPPCGHVAGIYARSDNERGVHKAPANEAILGPITDVTFNVNRGEQALLNPVGINCVRSFTGRGIRVWGARTLSSDPAWRYINVRRIFNFVEESIERSTQWVVFEPNDQFLWAKVRRDISAFLRNVWRSGALLGTAENQAFYVKCDAELNPQEVRDQGLLICEIGLAPVKPAEFVVFRFSQYAMETSA